MNRHINFTFFNTTFVSSYMYPENPVGTHVIVGSLNEHGIYIRHCQESNSQPVPSQAGADPTRPQWQTLALPLPRSIKLFILRYFYVFCWNMLWNSQNPATEFIIFCIGKTRNLVLCYVMVLCCQRRYEQWTANTSVALLTKHCLSR